jgi:hypothetical protein
VSAVPLDVRSFDEAHSTRVHDDVLYEKQLS